MTAKHYKKMTKSTWKVIIKAKSEEIMNREIQQNITTMKKSRFLRGVHIMKVNYVK